MGPSLRKARTVRPADGSQCCLGRNMARALAMAPMTSNPCNRPNRYPPQRPPVALVLRIPCCTRRCLSEVAGVAAPLRPLGVVVPTNLAHARRRQADARQFAEVWREPQATKSSFDCAPQICLACRQQSQDTSMPAEAGALLSITLHKWKWSTCYALLPRKRNVGPKAAKQLEHCGISAQVVWPLRWFELDRVPSPSSAARFPACP